MTPPKLQISDATRALHDAIDTNAPWLHPTARTIQRDLHGSPEVIAWQEAKLAFMMDGSGAWSELPHLYARYGTPGTAKLIAALRDLEGARCALVTDSGMQAFALVVDALIGAGDHAVILRQVYNKTRTFLELTAKRVGATITVVDDGDPAAVARAVTPRTKLVFAETFTNPLVRAQDVRALGKVGAKLVIDSTIATPWAFREPLLAQGADVVIGSLTKALGGQDTALGGYLATDDADLGNQIMDLVAMRGGILDDARALAVAEHLPLAKEDHARRCESARVVAAWLASDPRVERVWHPSLADHPDAAVIARDYVRTGSLLSFRAKGRDERGHRALADAIAATGIIRYALSFDGIATKVNHHKTVSEYFTPPEVVAGNGIDRLIRLGVGVEDANDLIACLAWALQQAT